MKNGKIFVLQRKKFGRIDSWCRFIIIFAKAFSLKKFDVFFGDWQLANCTQRLANGAQIWRI
jgi:hypothetical protein